MFLSSCLLMFVLGSLHRSQRDAACEAGAISQLPPSSGNVSPKLRLRISRIVDLNIGLVTSVTARQRSALAGSRSLILTKAFSTLPMIHYAACQRAVENSSAYSLPPHAS